MSSILDINSGSDSEDDQDYVPPNAAVSDESDGEISEEDNEPTPKKLRLDESTIDKGADSKPVIGKEAADSIWRDFLKGVDTCPRNEQKKTVASGVNVSSQSKNDSTELSTVEVKLPEKTASEMSTPENEVVSEKVLKDETASDDLLKERKEIPSENTVPDDSKKVKPGTAEVVRKTPKTGLASILGTIANKDKKMTVLQKSLLDWKSFKKEEGIEKDLETFNKGRQGFIERQRFLERSDLRLFESEKSARLSSSKR